MKNACLTAFRHILAAFEPPIGWIYWWTLRAKSILSDQRENRKAAP